LVNPDPSPENAVAVTVPDEGLNVRLDETFADVIVPAVTPVKAIFKSWLPVSIATVDPALVSCEPSPIKALAVIAPVALIVLEAIIVPV
jgi:hypothetical protein